MATFKAQIIFNRTDDDDVVNTVHVEHGTLDRAGAAVAVRDAWAVAWGVAPGPGIRTMYPNTVRPVLVKAYDLGAPPNSPSMATFPESVTAGVGTSQLPPQCAAVATLDSLTAGARGRGRMYIGPLISQFVNTNGRASLANIDNIRSNLVAFIASLNGAGWLLVIRSSVDGTSRVVRQVRVDDVVDTQRRRGFQSAINLSQSASDLQST